MSREFDIVVVGAGAVGSTAAALLIRSGAVAPGRLALLADRIPPPVPAGADWDLRVFALSRASQRVLQLCGAWERLPPDRVSPYERMCVWDAAGSPGEAGSLCFDCAEIGEPDLGSIVDGRALQAACLQAARSAGATVVESGLASVEAVDGAVRIGLTDGRLLRCRLLVAADGAGSPARDLLGIETAGHSYHQDAVVAHVRTGRGHRSTAWQRFLDTGPLALLPLGDGRSSLVWSTSPSEAARLEALDARDFGAALTAASGAVLGECELTTPVARFALRLQYATRYVGTRAVLLGDAAHVVHPLAGQGLNLGLLDVASLVDVLADANGAQDPGDGRLLRRYERWRRSENLAAATAMDGLERLFGSRSQPVRGLRMAGLDAVSRLPPLRREFARRALGLAGDVPRFLNRAGPPWPRR